MGNLFSSLKDKLIAKALSSLLPKYVTKYEGDIRRAVLAVNLLLTALQVAIPALPDQFEGKVEKELKFVQERWLQALALLNKYTGLNLTDKTV